MLDAARAATAKRVPPRKLKREASDPQVVAFAGVAGLSLGDMAELLQRFPLEHLKKTYNPGADKGGVRRGFWSLRFQRFMRF